MQAHLVVDPEAEGAAPAKRAAALVAPHTCTHPTAHIGALRACGIGAGISPPPPAAGAGANLHAALVRRAGAGQHTTPAVCVCSHTRCQRVGCMHACGSARPAAYSRHACLHPVPGSGSGSESIGGSGPRPPTCTPATARSKGFKLRGCVDCPGWCLAGTPSLLLLGAHVAPTGCGWLLRMGPRLRVQGSPVA